MLMDKELTRDIIKDIFKCIIDKFCFWRHGK